MRLIFAGTPEFAAVALDALVGAGYEIGLVLTQPDRPAGRGLKLLPSAVKKTAQKQSLAVEQPPGLKGAEMVARLEAVNADVMIVAAYGCILPKAILEVPRLGCINIHASLLPRWRGAAPIQRAILAGDAITGISIMQMNEGLDTGDVLIKRAIAIGEQETAGELHDRLAVLGGQLAVEALADLPVATPQENAEATYATKITTAEAAIDWRESSLQVLRKIRAFNPFPGASAQLAGERIKFWRASLAPASGEVGTVCKADAAGLTIACGAGAINVTELQRAGGKRLPVDAFLAGHPMTPGSRFTV